MTKVEELREEVLCYYAHPWYYKPAEEAVDSLIAAAREEGAAQMLEAAERLWGVVANVSGGNWEKQSAEWQEAAIKARDLFHAALPALSPKEDDNGEN